MLTALVYTSCAHGVAGVLEETGEVFDSTRGGRVSKHRALACHANKYVDQHAADINATDAALF